MSLRNGSLGGRQAGCEPPGSASGSGVSLTAAATPMRNRWRRGLGLAVVGITAAAVFGGDGIPIGRAAEPVAVEGGIASSDTRSDVLFAILAPCAKVAVVIGSFSEWRPVPLADNDGDGIWTTRIPLSPGRHEYAFVIDGRWLGQDPSADDYVGSFGEYSSVRYIGGKGGGE